MESTCGISMQLCQIDNLFTLPRFYNLHDSTQISPWAKHNNPFHLHAVHASTSPTASHWLDMKCKYLLWCNAMRKILEFYDYWWIYSPALVLLLFFICPLHEQSGKLFLGNVKKKRFLQAKQTSLKTSPSRAQPSQQAHQPSARRQRCKFFAHRPSSIKLDVKRKYIHMSSSFVGFAVFAHCTDVERDVRHVDSCRALDVLQFWPRFLKSLVTGLTCWFQCR